jgi:hypothetical protein
VPRSACVKASAVSGPSRSEPGMPTEPAPDASPARRSPPSTRLPTARRPRRPAPHDEMLWWWAIAALSMLGGALVAYAINYR